MAPHGWYRADIMSYGIASGDQLGLRWDRILRAVEGPLAVHFGPVAIDNEGTTIPSGHAEPRLTAPIDADSAPADDAGGAVPNLAPPADAADPAGASAPDLSRHPPYFAPEPLHDPSIDSASAPGDQAPPAGFIPKGEALIWSGPAIMAFPGDPHDTGSDAAPAPGSADISAAFLPEGDDPMHTPHGLDPAFAFTAAPMPPPPDFIG